MENKYMQMDYNNIGFQSENITNNNDIHKHKHKHNHTSKHINRITSISYPHLLNEKILNTKTIKNNIDLPNINIKSHNQRTYKYHNHNKIKCKHFPTSMATSKSKSMSFGDGYQHNNNNINNYNTSNINHNNHNANPFNSINIDTYNNHNNNNNVNIVTCSKNNNNMNINTNTYSTSIDLSNNNINNNYYDDEKEYMHNDVKQMSLNKNQFYTPPYTKPRSIISPFLYNIQQINLHQYNCLNTNVQQHWAIIFDWDDTLLPSYFLQKCGFRPTLNNKNIKISKDIKFELQKLETYVCHVLYQSVQFVGENRVCIITNAEAGWVQLSAYTFIPGVLPILSKIKIISARSQYEKQYPSSTIDWKREAFKNELQKMFRININYKKPNNNNGNINIKNNREALKPIKNTCQYAHTKPRTKHYYHILSFGDSFVERQAILDIGRCIKNSFIKSVKFKQMPTVTELIRELEIVYKNLPNIISHHGFLDYCIKIQLNNNHNNNYSSQSLKKNNVNINNVNTYSNSDNDSENTIETKKD